MAKAKELVINENQMLKEESKHLSAMVNRLQRLVTADQSKERKALDEWKRSRTEDTKVKQVKHVDSETKSTLHRHKSLPRLIDEQMVETPLQWQIIV